MQLGGEEVRNGSEAVRWRGYGRAVWVDFFERSSDLARISWVTSGGRGLRYVPTQMLGQRHSTSRRHALIRAHAAVEDTVGRVSKFRCEAGTHSQVEPQSPSCGGRLFFARKPIFFQARLVR